MTYGLSNGHVIDDVTWPRRCCEAVRSAILATAWLHVKHLVDAYWVYSSILNMFYWFDQTGLWFTECSCPRRVVSGNSPLGRWTVSRWKQCMSRWRMWQTHEVTATDSCPSQLIRWRTSPIRSPCCSIDHSWQPGSNCSKPLWQTRWNRSLVSHSVSVSAFAWLDNATLLS